MAKQNAKNNLNSDNKTFVLNCGKYVGAKDIPKIPIAAEYRQSVNM